MTVKLYIDLKKGWITDPRHGWEGGAQGGGAAGSGAPKPLDVKGDGAVTTTADPKRKLNPGVEYEYQGSKGGAAPAGEGWEKTSGSGYRRPKGMGGGKESKVDTEAETRQGDTKQAETKQAVTKQNTTDPFSPNPEDFKSDGPMEHYQHMETHAAAEGTDPKLTDMHRQLVEEKTQDFTHEDHRSLGEALGNEGMTDAAAKHTAVADSMAASAQQTAPEPETPEEGAARLKEKADGVKDAKVQEASNKKVKGAQDKHAKAQDTHKKHQTEAKEHRNAHVKAFTDTLNANAAVSKADEKRKKAAEVVTASAAKLKESESAAMSDHEKKADKAIGVAHKQHEKASAKAGSAAAAQVKATKRHKNVEAVVEKHTADINKHARERLKLQDKMQAHKDATPQHGDFEDTDKYNAAKSKHSLKGKALQAKLSENGSASSKSKQDLKEAKGKHQKTKKILAEADKAHKGAVKDAENAKKGHDGLVEGRKSLKAKDTPAVTKQREAHKAAEATAQDAEKGHASAVKDHEKAVKAEASAKKKADSSEERALKAEEAVGTAEEGVTTATKDAEAKQADQEKKAKDKEDAAAAKGSKGSGKEAGKAGGKEAGWLSGASSGFHAGRAMGESVGSAAASESGSGVASAAINYSTSGAVKAGHYILHPKAKRANFGAGAR